MKHAADFLSKFKNLTPPDEAVRSEIAKAVKVVAGVPVGKKDIALARGIAFVDCSSVAKNTIRLRRAEILDEVFHALPQARETVRDVR